MTIGNHECNFTNRLKTNWFLCVITDTHIIIKYIMKELIVCCGLNCAKCKISNFSQEKGFNTCDNCSESELDTCSKGKVLHKFVAQKKFEF